MGCEAAGDGGSRPTGVGHSGFGVTVTERPRANLAYLLLLYGLLYTMPYARLYGRGGRRRSRANGVLDGEGIARSARTLACSRVPPGGDPLWTAGGHRRR